MRPGIPDTADQAVSTVNGIISTHLTGWYIPLNPLGHGIVENISAETAKFKT
jgi:hypothetical protein